MHTDQYGSPISLDDPVARAAWDATCQAVLAHGAAAPGHLARTLEAAPDFALGHAAKGFFLLLLGRRALLPAAQEAHTAALRCMAEAGATEREAAFVEALGLWLAGAPSRAADRLEEVLAIAPADVLAAKLSHAIRFMLGDATGLLQVIERVLPAASGGPGEGYMRGCHAFGLEETGAYDAAAASGLRALELAPDDAWGLHAVAHVYDMTARTAEGLRFLQANEAAWAHCNNFRFHVWWHMALMHLDQGETEAALALYDAKIRAEKTDDYRDISNAASLLMRLELEGVPVGTRWEELAEISATHTDDGTLLFADLHYVMALVRTGRTDTAETLARHSIAQADLPCASDMGRVYACPGRAALSGLVSFSEGHYGPAFAALEDALANLPRAGGSHAQRDVFARMAIDAGLKSGQFSRTERLLSARTRQRAGAEDRFALTRRAMIDKGRRRARAGQIHPIDLHDA